MGSAYPDTGATRQPVFRLLQVAPPLDGPLVCHAGRLHHTGTGQHERLQVARQMATCRRGRVTHQARRTIELLG